VHYEQSQNEYQITKNGTIPENQRESLLGTRARSFGSFNSEFFVHSFTSFSNDQAPDNITQITTATTTAQVFHTKKKRKKKKITAGGLRLSRDVFIGGRQIPAYNRPIPLRSG
jgi:hypothetical protein